MDVKIVYCADEKYKEQLDILQKMAKDILNEYRKEYRKAGIQVKHYSDIDAFVLDYQTNQ